jgi:hypothetical protein
MAKTLTEAHNLFLLNLYRLAVDFYQPRIEARTGIPLGNIRVYDYERWYAHALRDMNRGPYRWVRAKLQKLLFRKRFREVASQMKSTSAERGKKAMACFYRNAIYVSFNVDSRNHEEGLALAVVHELGHALWNHLAAKPIHRERLRVRPPDQERFSLFVEGFATYAERIWFLDVYPQSVKAIMPYLQHQPGTVYHRGMLKVKELVDQHGKEILLETPTRWRRL